MNFAQTDEQKMVVDSAAKFAKTLRDKQRTTEKEGLTAELSNIYREMSFREMDWPEPFGGSKLGQVIKLAAIEELAFGDAAAALALDRVGWVCSPLLANAKIAARVYAQIKEGGDGFTPALCIDVDERLTIHGKRITGKLPYVPAAKVDALYVMRGTQIFALKSGLTLSSKLPGALDAMGASELTIDGEALWTEELTGPEALQIKGLWRLYLASVLVGLSRAAYEHTQQFCMERVTFGKRVAHHQAVAFMLADMATGVEAARLLIQQAAMGVDEGKDALAEMQLAFVHAAECALVVSTNGVQLLGSSGYVRDHPVEKWMREARAISLLAGGADGAQMDANSILAASMS